LKARRAWRTFIERTKGRRAMSDGVVVVINLEAVVEIVDRIGAYELGDFLSEVGATPLKDEINEALARCGVRFRLRSID
jgi:hypothetical protein